MSHLPPSQAGFFEAIQVYFTELTGRMALFGARDQELLETWKAEGRSARLVCRGIYRAVRAVEEGDKMPRSLYQCRSFVDDEWERARQSAVGGHQQGDQVSAPEQSSASVADDEEAVATATTERATGLRAQARQALKEAGQSCEQERWRRAYRQAWRKLREIDDDEFGFAQAQLVDQALIEAYLDALGEEERRLLEESVAAASAGLAQGMSPSARREHLLMQKKRSLIEQFELLDLLEALY